MFKMNFRVDYVDTDAMAVAHHASYFRWLERARVDWMRSQGIVYSELEKNGLYLPLRTSTVEYVRSLKFDDEGEIALRCGDMGKTWFDLEYTIYCAGSVVTRAKTSHVLCKKLDKGDTAGVDQWKPVRIPEDWRLKWAQHRE